MNCDSIEKNKNSYDDYGYNDFYKKGVRGLPASIRGGFAPLIEDIRGNKLCKKLKTLINKGFKALLIVQPIYHRMIH